MIVPLTGIFGMFSFIGDPGMICYVIAVLKDIIFCNRRFVCVFLFVHCCFLPSFIFFFILSFHLHGPPLHWILLKNDAFASVFEIVPFSVYPFIFVSNDGMRIFLYVFLVFF